MPGKNIRTPFDALVFNEMDENAHNLVTGATCWYPAEAPAGMACLCPRPTPPAQQISGTRLRMWCRLIVAAAMITTRSCIRLLSGRFGMRSRRIRWAIFPHRPRNGLRWRAPTHGPAAFGQHLDASIARPNPSGMDRNFPELGRGAATTLIRRYAACL